MKNYNTMFAEEVNALAVRYLETKDEFVYNDLFEKCNKIFMAAAKIGESKVDGSIPENEFLGDLYEVFMAVVKNFNPEKGGFLNLLNASTKKAVAQTIYREKYQRRTMEDENGNKKRVYIERQEVSCNASRNGDDSGWNGSMQPMEWLTTYQDKTSTYDYTKKLTMTDFYEFLEEENEKLAKISLLLADGHNYEEIATVMGRSGKASTLRTWVTRQVEKIRELYVEFLEISGINPDSVIIR